MNILSGRPREGLRQQDHDDDTRYRCNQASYADCKTEFLVFVHGDLHGMCGRRCPQSPSLREEVRRSRRAGKTPLNELSEPKRIRGAAEARCRLPVRCRRETTFDHPQQAGHTRSMKTAVSIPDEVFEEASASHLSCELPVASCTAARCRSLWPDTRLIG